MGGFFFRPITLKGGGYAPLANIFNKYYEKAIFMNNK